MHECLANLNLQGAILDIGGTKNAKYQKEIRGDHEFIVLNIDERYGYDIYCNLEEPFPIEDESYDHVLSCNVLEHIFNFDNVVSESFRALKSGGTVAQITPFMNPIHGTPHDFFRYTHFTLKKLYEKHGFIDVEIRPLATGIMMNVYQSTYFLIPFKPLKFIYRKWMFLLEACLNKCSKKYKDLSGNYVLSYFLTAKKP